MLQSNNIYGNNAQMNPGDRMHSLPMAADYGKKSVRTFFDFSYTNVPESQNKYSPLLFLFHLRRISKVKVVSFLLGLSVTFLIMASYILMWDKRGIVFTPSSYQMEPVIIPANEATAQVSSKRKELDMNRLVKLITSKQEYTPRKVPDVKEIFKADLHLFSEIPRLFLPNIKSPCWYQEFSPENHSEPYKTNHFTLRSKTFKAVCKDLRANFSQHLHQENGKHFRLRCLPYFYIIGQPKCGTTDLFHRLRLHPEVKYNTLKEPHWWTRKRFGYIRFKDGPQESFTVDDYLDLFDLAAHSIHKGILGNTSGDDLALQLITGEASASTMWDNQVWSYQHVNKEQQAPPILVQDYIHAVHPDAKIIIMLRDPVERLYSDYLYFKTANKSAEDFHLKVVQSVHLFQSCLSEKSLRFCVYDSNLFNAMPVRLNVGMYIIFLLDWLTVFHRGQILVLRLEEYAANLKATIRRVFDFLSVGPLPELAEAALTKRPMSNTRRAADKKIGPMLPVTRELLNTFYQPFNQKLATVLDNKAFLWTNS
ncbi:carbohydrate sulfotransferase 15-like [Gouania willdenowi]|uniref:Sulfotransferase n=1 Tax=Gouania willdenowi TaxID=441366 RepID=A0A8C5N6P5_GOUWI|nr:carbohydrate sulfotransferase 15-like [Gouania willdenowi]XP_028325292.1 carbohydrate sulfotransferase 15-like [Gouania willdenowi]